MANRLLAVLVPVLWLGSLIALLLMPLLADASLAGNVWDWARTSTTHPDPTEGDDEQDAQGDLLTGAFGSAIPPGVKDLPSENLRSDAGEQGADPEQDDEQELFLNRAERRAVQREDRRNTHPRR